jgi:NAD(P)-dependent dehydrogenase (short-subunit alcohol dehydrogenase family)
MSILAGKVAVISGGTTGIGLATARRFVAEGAHVFIFGQRQTPLDEAVKLIGRNVTAILADAGNLDGLDRVAAAVRDEKGVVDIIVSNADLVEQASIETLTPDHFDKTFNLNARGPVFLVPKLLPLMRRDGSIIWSRRPCTSWAFLAIPPTRRLRRRCVPMPAPGPRNSRIAEFA